VRSAHIHADHGVLERSPICPHARGAPDSSIGTTPPRWASSRLGVMPPFADCFPPISPSRLAGPGARVFDRPQWTVLRFESCLVSRKRTSRTTGASWPGARLCYRQHPPSACSPTHRTHWRPRHRPRPSGTRRSQQLQRPQSHRHHHRADPAHPRRGARIPLHVRDWHLDTHPRPRARAEVRVDGMRQSAGRCCVADTGSGGCSAPRQPGRVRARGRAHRT
jgi:hypothetical protein